jgi:hypothetical protein
VIWFSPGLHLATVFAREVRAVEAPKLDAISAIVNMP